MQDNRFFTRHYDYVQIAIYTALTAMIVFFMALSTPFHVGLLIASVLFLMWMLHSTQSDELPCGAPISSEAIARPRPGSKLP